MATWILICDASTGKLYKTPGKVQKMFLVQEFEHPESRSKGTDLVSDRPGSTGGTAGMHGGNPSRSNPKEVEADHFAVEMARHLNKGHAENAYEHLIIVAPPQFLGLIKGHLNNGSKKLISQTLDKDFSHLKERELKTSLEKYMR